MRVRDAGRAHGSALMRGLTFELTRPARWDDLPAAAMMNHGAAAGKAARLAGSRVERGVRPRSIHGAEPEFLYFLHEPSLTTRPSAHSVMTL